MLYAIVYLPTGDTCLLSEESTDELVECVGTRRHMRLVLHTNNFIIPMNKTRPVGMHRSFGVCSDIPKYLLEVVEIGDV